ncbi:hypothetical protein [Lactiplantibacillus plajomi]|uniref:Uncharacterized protein n=1 Tax=Lactiplantibacillus plajomi TaxID=1457217 RepID=A0ABV6K646_9LACO|nr:hypothetical protein [Lactiplantibacillus plajomi]
MSLRSWQFNDGDLDFIQKYYPDLYRALDPTIAADRRTIAADRRTVAMTSDEQWDRIENLFVDSIAESLTEDGELTENGLKIESILDFV